MPTTPGIAQTLSELPSPLGLGDVIRLAGERRDEIQAAQARSLAGEALPAIVSSLEDPMLSPSIDHYPFMMGGADYSLTIEQQIPLSRLRRNRRSSALADVDRFRAEVDRTVLDVSEQAAEAFLMLWGLRRTWALVDDQLALARDIVLATNARYASGTAPQSDVLRAELEVARVEVLARTLVHEVLGAEAMLMASLAMDVDHPVPELAPVEFTVPVPAWTTIQNALPGRPELAVGRAEVARAEAEISVMRAMSRPMVLIRTGPASTMAEGRGWMAMVGVSLPIWRGRLNAGVEEARAMYAMAEADLRAMTRMIEGDAAVALSRLQAARDRQSAIVSDVLPRARMAIDPAVAGYTSGQLPLISVIETVQALWLVQADLIAAETELGLAWTRLGRTAGSFSEIFQ